MSSEGFDVNKSKVSEDALAEFLCQPIIEDLTSVPGVGPKTAELLGKATDDGELVDEPITTTYQLIGKFLSLRGKGFSSKEHCDAMWFYLKAKGMTHVRGAPYHPQTQGKIERWHQTLKNRILLEHDFLPGDLRQQIEDFVEYYNHGRYHDSLNNVTPADAYFGRAQPIIKQRERIKQKTIEQRRLQYRRLVA